MPDLKSISRPIEIHLESFESEFRKALQSPVPLLNTIMKFMIRRKGKQIRPMFVILSAGLFGNINDKTYRAAAMIELLHNATLIHDDVVDDSNERRGFFSLNALWKNKISVLTGDFLLSKGLLLSVENSDFDILRTVTQATKEMSEGELLQIEKARKLDIKEDIYFEIIRKKTASLIAACCACGAQSADTGDENIRKMKLFGEYTGIAFQIKDDLFDYAKKNLTGKPNGIDIKEQKMTLPLINMLNNSSPAEKKHVINIIRNHNHNREMVNEVIDMVNRSKGISYATEKMHQFKNMAVDIIRQFPDSEYRDSLENLVTYTIERKK